MAIAKLISGAILGALKGGTVEINGAIPTTIPLSSAYTRQQKPFGYVIGGRSEAKFYGGGGSSQVFTATEYSIALAPGYQPFPAEYDDHLGSTNFNASVQFDQPNAIGGFTAGNVVIVGLNAGLSTDTWNVAIVTDSSAVQGFHPPTGHFTLSLPMRPGAITLLNTGAYPGNPGEITGPNGIGNILYSLQFIMS